MGENVVKKIGDWFWHKELAYLAKKIVILVIAFLASPVVAGHPIDLASLGIHINIDQAQATTAIFAGLEYLREYIRKKTKWWWI